MGASPRSHLSRPVVGGVGIWQSPSSLSRCAGCWRFTMKTPGRAHDELFAVMIVVVALIVVALCVADLARDLEASQAQEVAP
jgi:hypothetical protein